ncbi:MAG TPA: ABC transporter permease [Gemmatimonadaceae bacterium]|nr:ABC transporter permease [Gemmatimonadaceae bacterium]
MIASLAIRNIAYRPWRSMLLFFGFGIGVAVMIVLLSIGEAMLSQARNEKLVGGGTVTVLPEGLDVEVMKTGGIGGLFFSIDHAAFLYRQLFASPRFANEIAAVAPQIERRLLYVRTTDGREFPVQATGEIPSLTRAVGAGAEVVSGSWVDDEGDRRWARPTLVELRNDIDHFHLPSDTLSSRDTWAEWHYFNVISSNSKRWAFISFIVGGDVTSDNWGGQIGITLRDQGGRTRRFALPVNRSDVHFSTTDANLVFGKSHVTLLPNGDYDVQATAFEAPAATENSRIDIRLQVHPAAYAYFPGVSMGAGTFVSGYTVPGLRAIASGSLCVDGVCETLRDAQSYHDHHWGVWRGVTWDWGATRAGEYALLYGRVYPPDSTSTVPPVLVYLVDSLGFRAVFRPKSISYTDGRSVSTINGTLRVPSAASFTDIRGDDTLRVDLEIEDAIATDTRPTSRRGEAERGDPLRTDKSHPFFIQMKGTARISGRLEGQPLAGSGTGFFETYR